MKIILGSKSPRRKELLELLDIDFSIEVNEVNEVFPKELENSKVAEFLSQVKSNAFRDLKDNEVLITSDTVVIHENQILGKPKSILEASDMLNNLSNSTNFVSTGVTIRSNEKTLTFSTSTKVFFDVLTKEEINYYIERYKPLDKAGSYGIQEWIGAVGIQKIEGCFYNVMGLPLHDLMKKLKSEFHYRINNE